MQNFSMKRHQEKTFILNYRIELGQMIIKLASKEKYVIPYTVDNEKNVLNRMRKQVLRADAFETKQRKRFSDAIVNIVVAFFLEFISIYLLINPKEDISFVWSIIGIVFGGILMMGAIYWIIQSQRRIIDLRKNRLFLKQEKRLNDNIKNNQNILFHTSRKTRAVISSKVIKHQIAFTFNTIDDIKYKELKRILDNINRAEEFGFLFEVKKEERKKQHTKKNKTKYKDELVRI